MSDEQGTEKAFDPRFIQTSESSGGLETVTVRTSRFVYLHQEAKSSLADAFLVPDKKDLTFYGDIVRVVGEITAPGRTIKIVCRRLEFDRGEAKLTKEKQLERKAPRIDVSGEKGEDAGIVTEPAASAATNGTDDWAWSDDSPYPRRAGQPGNKDTGNKAEDGKNGMNGGNAGKILIYCNNLVRWAPVELCANGGNGGRGGAGRKGQQGGNGWSPFRLDWPVSRYKTRCTAEANHAAKGGQGGNGGNGGDGGAGGNGGTIELCCLKLEHSDQTLTVSASAGRGGNGGPGGEGGKGGDGGSPESREVVRTGEIHGDPILRSADGADSGGGGAYGVPGYGGSGGIKQGCIVLKSPTPSDWLEALPHLFLICEPAQNGKAGGDLTGFPYTPGYRVSRRYKFAPSGDPGKHNNSWGSEGCRDGYKGEPNDPNKKTPWPWVPATLPGRTWEKWGGFMIEPPEVLPDDPESQAIAWRDFVKARNAGVDSWNAAVRPECWERAGHKDIAAQADTDQLEMLFDQLRTRCLLTDMSKASESIGKILETLEFLVLIADAKKDNPAILTLRESAAGTLHNARLGCNVFGKDAGFAAFGSVDKYKKDFKNILAIFTNVETTYKQLQKDLSKESERQTYLSNVLAYQDDLRTELRHRKTEMIDATNDAANAIDTLEASRQNLQMVLDGLLKNFQKQVDDKIGIALRDFPNLLTQLSFTNAEEGGLGVRGWLMIGSQVGDMATKAIQDVPTDTGASINKNYVIRRMQSLGKDIQTIAGLKKKHGELVTDPSAEYRLLATRDQVDSICSNFYDTFPEARKITNTLDTYIEAVTTRNEKVEEYNQLLSGLRYVCAELNKVEAENNKASDSHSKKSNPGLPAMAKFSTALYRHALEKCLEHLYMACRVFTMQSLSMYDVFSQVLGKLAAGASTEGELNSTALGVGLIDLISKELEHEQSLQSDIQPFKPLGNQCWIRVTKEDSPAEDSQSDSGAFQITNPILFAMLQDGQAGTYQILPTDRNMTTEETPFAQKANVRLQKIRCRAIGMETSDNIHRIFLTHPGIETFVTEHDEKVGLWHTPFKHLCEFNSRNNEFMGDGALRPERWMIGPFCEWIIEIPKEANKNLDLTGLTGIEIEFEGTCQTFVKKGVENFAGSGTTDA